VAGEIDGLGAGAAAKVERVVGRELGWPFDQVDKSGEGNLSVPDLESEQVRSR
jgi:hypothetical protein